LRLKSEVSYVGHVLTYEGVFPDPNKIAAIVDMPVPHDKQAVMRFLGMVTYLGKFKPNVSQLTAPLRDIVKSTNEYHWDLPQEEAFNGLKNAFLNLLFLDTLTHPVKSSSMLTVQRMGLVAYSCRKKNRSYFSRVRSLHRKITVR
jgi:hypothetical protein